MPVIQTVPSDSSAHIAPTLQSLWETSLPRDATTKSKLKRDLQSRQRAWLQEIIKSTGLSAYQVAKQSGVSDGTLSRLLNDPEYEFTMSQLTVDRIRARFNVPSPEDVASGTATVIGFTEGERIEPKDEPPVIARVLKEVMVSRPSITPWRIKTDAIVEVGYLAGDVVMVDANETPQPQDVVCAQVFDWKGGGAETVFRVYMPPYLIGAAHDRTAYKPLLVDGERVLIKGVVVESFRPHRLSATR